MTAYPSPVNLATILAGSRLYGLDGPESDTDWKRIHLPHPAFRLTSRGQDPVNTKEGEGDGKVESESFSLQRWLQLAANGEDVAMTMLASNPSHWTTASTVWRDIHAQRSQFYTQRMSGALGYAKSMAFKHALRADRMVVVESVIATLKSAQFKGVQRLSEVWDELPSHDAYITRTVNDSNRDAVDKRVYTVAGKGLPANVAPDYALRIMVSLHERYGDRVRAAKEMKGTDYKALSHSFRVGYQLLHLYREGTFSFPLPESPFIRDVKYGRLSYLDDGLDTKLNDLITEVETLAAASTFPERVDQSWLDGLVLDAYDRVYSLKLSPIS